LIVQSNKIQDSKDSQKNKSNKQIKTILFWKISLQ